MAESGGNPAPIMVAVWPGDRYNCPIGTCRSCSQSWTDHDVQQKPTERAADRVLVKWHKFKGVTEEGTQRPYGHECYKCFASRRGHFGSMEQWTLDDMRLESQKLDRKFCECRQDKVQGIKRKEHVDAKAILEETREGFQENVAEGTFYELLEFCVKQGSPVKTQQEARDLCRSLGVEVVVDENSVEGVEVADLGPKSYRFRRGVRDVQRLVRKAEPMADTRSGQDAELKARIDCAMGPLTDGKQPISADSLRRRLTSKTKLATGTAVAAVDGSSSVGRATATALAIPPRSVADDDFLGELSDAGTDGGDADSISTKTGNYHHGPCV